MLRAFKPFAVSAIGLSIATAVCVPIFAQSSYSLNEYLNCAREPRILEALELMGQTPEGQQSLSFIIHRPIRVIFKDLRLLDKRVKDYDALSFMTGSGQLMIYINQKHVDAPVGALAAILSHEALHNDLQNSMNEEVAGWTQEAKVWHEIKKKDPWLQRLVPGQYPLVDRLNLLESHLQKGTLVSFVRSQPAYHGLPDSSPGYSETVASISEEPASH